MFVGLLFVMAILPPATLHRAIHPVSFTTFILCIVLLCISSEFSVFAYINIKGIFWCVHTCHIGQCCAIAIVVV